MITHFDHVTIGVRDVAAATRFFELLGFEHERTVTISGETFSRYMGTPGLVAEHVTLVLRGAEPRLEVQLLRFTSPDPTIDPNIASLCKTGFNHVCVATDDLDAELARLRAAGVETRSEVLDFRGCKLVFLRGPEGVCVELSERSRAG
ncbi:MAG TPA: VOC family protein [Casimicrobiaceae bacterium]|nr:VOC family protein [Casimicrobiaceae bacterium]